MTSNTTEKGNEPLLDVRAISLAFGGVNALSEVSIEVYKQTRIGLIGPNGAGKSTLVNCITGHYRPTAGSIHLDGRDVGKAPPRKRVAMGVARTFQNLLLFEDQTAYENVVFGAFLDWLHGGKGEHSRSAAARLRAARTDAYLASFGLDDVRDRPVCDLPYATKKRVELARALMANPSVLILDEPTAGLGESDRADFMAVLEQAQAEHGFALMIVAHDMDVIFRLCSNIYVLDYGKVIATGPPERIRNNALVREIYLGGDE